MKERNGDMLKNNPILKNPLMRLGYETEDILTKGEFGAVIASSGVGKTALLVQLALNTLLRSKNVLHISLDDPVNKVGLWYEEVFQNLVHQYKVKQAAQVWETILPHRFIMTFKVGGFSPPKLEERLNDLTQQGIFFPQMAIIDGLPFVESVRNSLSELKLLAKAHSMSVWFTVRSHRHEKPGPDGMPSLFSHVADLFEAAILIHPVGNKTHIRALKGNKAESGPPLILDPSTMLMKNSEE